METLADYRELFDSADDSVATGRRPITRLQTLAEDETIARLATGIKRFKLPDEFNFIKIYQQIAAEPKTGHGEEALEAIGPNFREPPAIDPAADYWQQAIRNTAPGPRIRVAIGSIRSSAIGADSIPGPQPAGRGAKVDFRFRNGRHVSFEAHAIKVEKLLDDVKAYLNSHPRPPDWPEIRPARHRLPAGEENQQQYVGAKVASWDLDLEPRRPIISIGKSRSRRRCKKPALIC